MKTVRQKIIVVLLVLGVSSGLVFAGMQGYALYREKQRVAAELAKRRAAWADLRQKLNLKVVGFNGEAGVVIKDMRTGWTISLNQDDRIPSASVVKVPIMAVCFWANKAGKLDFQKRVVLTNGCKVSGSGVLKNCHPGSEYSVQELISLMVTESDNTAANMLIDMLGMTYLNSTFKAMGLRDTNISRKMMDFESRSSGIENYTSACDISLVLEKMYKGTFLDKDISRQCMDILKGQRNRDRIPARLPPYITVAHKTGLERGICHDAGIVYTSGGDFLICVLTKHRNKTAYPVKEFISRIAQEVYKYVTAA